MGAADADNKEVSDPWDPRIHLAHHFDAAYWASLYGVSLEELRAAVASVGPRAEDVRQYLGK